MHESRDRPWLSLAVWVLALSYGVGAPVVAVLEYHGAVFSQRFALPAFVIYTTSAVQIACVPLLFSKRHAVKAALALTVITVGAVFSHVRIGSQVTALPALGFTALQLWVAARVGGQGPPTI